MKIEKGYLVSVLILLLLVAATPAMAAVSDQCPCPPGTPINPETGNIECTLPGPPVRDIACRSLSAGDGFITMADGKVQYIFGFADLTGHPLDMWMDMGMLAANFSAPTIIVDEGREFYLNLTNAGMIIRPDLFDPHTVHWHGFPQASAVFDGVPDASISINMGSTLTYYYNVVETGTFMYHCHVEATEHMQMGMLGNLYVRPGQNGTQIEYQGRTYDKFVYNDDDGSTGYNVEYPIQIVGFDSNFHDASESVQPLPFAAMKDNYPMLNGRGYPDTVNPDALEAPEENGGKISQAVSAAIEATVGERILLRISSLDVTQFYTLASLGIPMRVVGINAKHLRSLTTGENLYYTTNSVTLGGGETIDVILDTQGITAGTYFLYTTNLNYLSNNAQDFGGMMTEIKVNPNNP